MDMQRSASRSISRRRSATNGSRSRRPTASPVAAVAPIASRDAWWDVDAEVLATLGGGPKSPEEIAETLGMSADTITSLVALLAQQGKLRIRLVDSA